MKEDGENSKKKSGDGFLRFNTSNSKSKISPDLLTKDSLLRRKTKQVPL